LSLTRKTRGRPFCFLFNLRATLRGIDARVRRESGGEVYRVTSDGQELVFRHEAQAYYACKRGISKRLALLRETYFLPLIEFRPGDLVVDCGANVGELSRSSRMRRHPRFLMWGSGTATANSISICRHRWPIPR